MPPLLTYQHCEHGKVISKHTRITEMSEKTPALAAHMAAMASIAQSSEVEGTPRTSCPYYTMSNTTEDANNVACSKAVSWGRDGGRRHISSLVIQLQVQQAAHRPISERSRCRRRQVDDFPNDIVSFSGVTYTYQLMTVVERDGMYTYEKKSYQSLRVFMSPSESVL